VDIPAISMPIARSIKTWDICGIVLCDKTAHFRVAFYCPQHKVHLCNDLTNKNVNKSMHKMWENLAFGISGIF
jgi:hypothetical protein